MTEHPRDDLAAYALGALDESERRAVEAHLATCESCTAEVESYRGTLYAYAAAAETAAPDLRARVVARARGERPAPSRRDNAWTGWLRRPVPVFVPIALAVLLVISLVGVVQSRSDADRYAAALNEIAASRVVSLDATDATSGVRGALVIPERGSPYLLLRVPAPPEGRAWEAWVLHGSTPLPAGLATRGGVITITLTAPLTPGDGAAVTLEPASGSAAPTSTPVLAVPRT